MSVNGVSASGSASASTGATQSKVSDGGAPKLATLQTASPHGLKENIAILQQAMGLLGQAVATLCESVKTISSEERGPPPSDSSFPIAAEVPHIEAPYKKALAQPIKKGEKTLPRTGEELANRAKQKLLDIRQNTNPKKPICYKCGDSGHLAASCRSKLVCFACRRVGHRSWECDKIVTNPKPPEAKAIKTPPPVPEQEKSPDENLKREKIDLKMLPLKAYNDSPATQELEATFQRSVVLYDVEGLGRERILADLRAQANFRWKVSETPAGLMLIEGPSWWREKVLRDESAIIEEKPFHVEPWHPSMDAGLRLKSVWVRIIGFPMKLWSRFEFERLIEEFGVLLEIDLATKERLCFREAKIRIGVCKMERIPHEMEIRFKNERGEWVWRVVQFIIDTPGFKGGMGNKKRKIWLRRPDPESKSGGAGTSSDPKGKRPVIEEEPADDDEDLMSDDVDEELYMEDSPDIIIQPDLAPEVTHETTVESTGLGNQKSISENEVINASLSEILEVEKIQNAQREVGNMMKGDGVINEERQLVVYN